MSTAAMTHLSPRAVALVRSLQQRPSVVGRLFGWRLDPATLSALEELGEALVAPLLLPYVIDGDTETRDRVAALIRSLMSTIPADALFDFDQASRSVRGYAEIDLSHWYSLTAGDVRRLATVRDSTALLGVASCCPSGYVREAAVSRLDARPGDDGLPYLLVRLNDWVAPVAERARASIMRRVNRAADVWVTCLPLVARLRDTTRRGHTEVVNAVFAFLRRPTSRLALQAGLVSSNRTTRRLSYKLAREGAGNDLVSLVTRALRDDDPIVRLEALRDASERVDDESLATLLDLAETDVFVPVRRAALLLRADRFPDSSLEQAKRALLDSSASLRELARYIVGKREAEFAFADLYRGRLSTTSDATIVTALAGLGETGASADTVVVTPFLSHRRAAVRAQAVRTLGRLNADAHGDVFVAALSDVSPRVTHAARDVLQQNPSLVDFGMIAGAMRSGPRLHGRLDALTLGDTLGKWPSLLLWLEATESNEVAIAQKARERVSRWIQRANRRYTEPSPRQIEAIQELLSRRAGTVNDTMPDQLQGYLQPWLGKTGA